jgi:polysaccharide pyruvyl transferase WcaK-like protein
VKRAAIFGEFDSNNLGDQLIGKGSKIIIESAGYVATTFPLEENRQVEPALDEQNDVKVSRRVHRLLYKNNKTYTHLVDLALMARRFRSYRRYVAKIIGNHELIVVGGGQLLSDNTLRMPLRLLWIIRTAREFRRKVVVIGVGMRPHRSFLSGVIFRRIFKALGSDPIFVRDAHSAKVAASYCPAGYQPIQAIPDSAIPAVREFAKAEPRNPDPYRVGLAPINFRELPNGVASARINSDYWWVDLSEALGLSGCRPVLFCSGTYSDYDRCLGVQALAAARGIDIELLPRPKEPDELLTQLNSFAHILGQRLHISISFLALGGTPTALAWDRKVNDFYAGLGLQARVIGDLDLDPQSACRLILQEGRSNVDWDALTSNLIRTVTQAIARPQ